MNKQSENSSSETLIVPDAAFIEALAEFAAGAGHEINNPLATIIGRAQLLLKDEKDPHRRQMLQTIGAQAYRIRDMIGDTMLFGRPPKPQLKEVSLKEVVEKVIDRLSQVLADSECQIVFDIPRELKLHADPVQCSIVISELIRNSCQATLSAGSQINIRAVDLGNGRCQIEVEDFGKGFTKQERIHAFNPFFSGRQAGRGLGFGLPKCWQILRQHQGSIEIESLERIAEAAGRTVVRMMWPTSST